MWDEILFLHKTYQVNFYMSIYRHTFSCYDLSTYMYCFYRQTIWISYKAWTENDACQKERDKKFIREHTSTPLTSRSVTPADMAQQQSESNDEVPCREDPSTRYLVNASLLAWIEILESEMLSWRYRSIRSDTCALKISRMMMKWCVLTQDLCLVQFSVVFFEFLRPVAENVNIWNLKEFVHRWRCSRKLDAKNQLFLTLVKLKLNLKFKNVFFLFWTVNFSNFSICYNMDLLFVPSS